MPTTKTCSLYATSKTIINTEMCDLFTTRRGGRTRSTTVRLLQFTDIRRIVFVVRERIPTRSFDRRGSQTRTGIFGMRFVVYGMRPTESFRKLESDKNVRRRRSKYSPRRRRFRETNISFRSFSSARNERNDGIDGIFRFEARHNFLIHTTRISFYVIRCASSYFIKRAQVV